MAAYDNVAMPGAPGAMSYGAGLVDFAPLGQIADSYFKGQKEQRAEKVAGAFKDGIPEKDGQPDYNAMASKLFQLGDYGGGSSLASTGIARDQLALGNKLVPVIGQLPGLPGQAGQAPQATAAPSLAAPPASAPVRGGSPTGYNGGDNGQNTVAALVMAKMPEELAGPAINRIAGRLGIDPNAPLTEDQVMKVGLGLTAEGAGTPTGGATPGAPPQAMAQAAPQDQGATQPPPNVQRAIANGERRLEAMTTPERRIQWLSQVASSAAVPKPINEWANKRLEAEYKALEPTTEMKNAAASGISSPAELKLREEQNKDEVTRYGKKYEAISKAGSEAAVELPQLQIAKQIMSDPNFYSGPGEGLNKAYKRLLATIGGDPNTAQPQEAFSKVISNSILSQIRSLAGTGPVRVAEIRIMERAVASHDNTPAANRTLVEMSTRLHQHALAVDGIARNYNKGRLDPGFDTAVREYEQQHPLFTPQELKDPRAIGAPTFATPQAAVAAGFPSGSPIRTPDGRIKYLP